MKIKITSANRGIIPDCLWYAGRIGEVFDVKYTINNHIYVDKGGYHNVGCVHREDCEVLSGTVEKNGQATF